MSGLKTSFAAIHNVNAPAELKFSAAMVASAVEAARSGDCEAYAWIERCSLRWLHAVTPDGDDCQRIRDQLLATVPEPIECPGAGTFQPSETATYAQLFLPGGAEWQ